MKVTVCDICGEQMSTWFSIKIIQDTDMSNACEPCCNIRASAEQHEICADCLNEIKKFVKKEMKQQCQNLLF